MRLAYQYASLFVISNQPKTVIPTEASERERSGRTYFSHLPLLTTFLVMMSPFHPG
jgi:hypothetical protein